MKLESSFEVPATRDQAWDLLMDVPRVVPCMPGATLKEEVSENEWRAEMAVKLGPISMIFDTTVVREHSDEAAGNVLLAATAKEKRARGRATANIESTLTPAGDMTRVDIVTDLTLGGAVAQYGRGIVQDVSEQMVDQFAANLNAQLRAPAEPAASGGAPAGTPAGTAPAPGPTPPPPAKPIGGLRIGMQALLRALLRSIGRLFGRSPRRGR